MTAASVANFGGLNMVFSIWLKKAERCESFDQLTTDLWSCKPLENFLQYKTRGKDLVCSFKSMPKCAYFWG